MKLRKKNIVEVIDFDEMIEFGIDDGANIINSMPWSFNIGGFSVTHERDDLYIVDVTHGDNKMTPEKYLILDGVSCYLEYKNVVNETHESLDSGLESYFDKECRLPNGMIAKIKGMYRTQRDAPLQLYIEYWNKEGVQSSYVNYKDIVICD